jgi:hypothetical protein
MRHGVGDWDEELRAAGATAESSFTPDGVKGWSGLTTAKFRNQSRSARSSRQGTQPQPSLGSSNSRRSYGQVIVFVQRCFTEIG